MPLSPPLVLEAGSGTKFQLLPFFNIVGPFLGLTRNLGARHIVFVITKSTLTCTNCSKTCHSLRTCHNKKKNILVVPITTIKSIEPVIKTKTQLVKLGIIHVCYPYIICFNA
jgi:hypothetical protein